LFNYDMRELARLQRYPETMRLIAFQYAINWLAWFKLAKTLIPL
jgi:hypothetical protein